MLLKITRRSKAVKMTKQGTETAELLNMSVPKVQGIHNGSRMIKKQRIEKQ